MTVNLMHKMKNKLNSPFSAFPSAKSILEGFTSICQNNSRRQTNKQTNSAQIKIRLISQSIDFPLHKIQSSVRQKFVRKCKVGFCHNYNIIYVLFKFTFHSLASMTVLRVNKAARNKLKNIIIWDIATLFMPKLWKNEDILIPEASKK